VYLFKGEVEGEIVLPRAIEKAGEFGFDPYFLPNGSSFTLAESKADYINARAKAVQALINHKPEAVLPPIRDWKGAWQ
jgi:inosine/xanthosine triphosphate pyrophosphatase family protein